MFHVVLFEPEIPPNTGNIIRLCANTGTNLHLIRPLGFDMDDRKLKRAGLDYHEWASVQQHENLTAFAAAVQPARTFAFTTKGKILYTEIQYQANDAFLFGPETRGLPKIILDSIPLELKIRLPMLESSRSLNLSNTVAVAIYEAWRQLGFASLC